MKGTLYGGYKPKTDLPELVEQYLRKVPLLSPVSVPSFYHSLSRHLHKTALILLMLNYTSCAGLGCGGVHNAQLAIRSYQRSFQALAGWRMLAYCVALQWPNLLNAWHGLQAEALGWLPAYHILQVGSCMAFCNFREFHFYPSLYILETRKHFRTWCQHLIQVDARGSYRRPCQSLSTRSRLSAALSTLRQQLNFMSIELLISSCPTQISVTNEDYWS